MDENKVSALEHSYVTISAEVFKNMVERYTKAECEADNLRGKWYAETVRCEKLEQRVKELENGHS